MNIIYKFDFLNGITEIYQLFLILKPAHGLVRPGVLAWESEPLGVELLSCGTRSLFPSPELHIFWMFTRPTNLLLLFCFSFLFTCLRVLILLYEVLFV